MQKPTSYTQALPTNYAPRLLNRVLSNKSEYTWKQKFKDCMTYQTLQSGHSPL